MGKIRPYDVYERYEPPDAIFFLSQVGCLVCMMAEWILQSAEGTKQVFYWGNINDPLPC